MSSNSNNLFRGWTSTDSGRDPELQKLEEQAHETRQKLHELREQGRQNRVHRLQTLDALETRRVTLTEISNRMEQELMDRNVYEYGDVVAEAFGERKIFAHRAIGLEALLCQMMHQMLAKQHQLKLAKKASKSIQSHYKQQKNQNRDEFHSYDAMAVQLEASRLTLEAIYDDIFAAQHSLLAQLNHVEAGGTITNYKVVKEPKKSKKKPSLTVSTKYPSTPSTNKPSPVRPETPTVDDYHVALDILSSRGEDHPGVTKNYTDGMTSPKSRAKANGSPKSPTKSPTKSPRKQRRSSSDPEEKPARQRLREIEHLRKARVIGKSSSTSLSQVDLGVDDESPTSARERLRKLEKKKESMSTPVESQTKENGPTSAKLDELNGELKERRTSRSNRRSQRSNSTTKPSTPRKKLSSASDGSTQSGDSNKEEADEEERRRRRESRKARAAARQKERESEIAGDSDRMQMMIRQYEM